MQILWTILGSVLASTGLSTVVLALLNRHWAKQDRAVLTKEDIQPITQALDNLIVHSKVVSVKTIRELVRQRIDDGKIELEEKENIREMFRSYKALGGNGHLDTVMEELDKLEVI